MEYNYIVLFASKEENMLGAGENGVTFTNVLLAKSNVLRAFENVVPVPVPRYNSTVFVESDNGQTQVGRKSW